MLLKLTGKRMKKHILSCIFVILGVSNILAQGSECLKEVLAFEDSIYLHKKVNLNKPFFIHYAVRSEDWDKNIVYSNVKLYQGKGGMHFYADQVNIFADEKEMYMILPEQKVIIINLVEKKAPNQNMDEFLKYKKKFLSNCEIESCKTIDSLKNVKQLKLKVKDGINDFLAIRSMSYKIDTQTSKVLATSVSYTKEYKLKKMDIKYIDYQALNHFSFGKARKKVLGSNGKLLAKYKGYEILDER